MPPHRRLGAQPCEDVVGEAVGERRQVGQVDVVETHAPAPFELRPDIRPHPVLRTMWACVRQQGSDRTGPYSNGAIAFNSDVVVAGGCVVGGAVVAGGCVVGGSVVVGGCVVVTGARVVVVVRGGGRPGGRGGRPRRAGAPVVVVGAAVTVVVVVGLVVVVVTLVVVVDALVVAVVEDPPAAGRRAPSLPVTELGNAGHRRHWPRPPTPEASRSVPMTSPVPGQGWWSPVDGGSEPLATRRSWCHGPEAGSERGRASGRSWPRRRSTPPPP